MTCFLRAKSEIDLGLYVETSILSRLNGKEETLFCNIESKVEPLHDSIMKTNRGILCTVKYTMHTRSILDLNLEKITHRDKYAILYRIFSYMCEGLSRPVINFEAISKSPDFEKILKVELKEIEKEIKPINAVSRKPYIKLVTNVINLMVLLSKGDLIDDSCIYENSHSFELTLTSILYDCLLRLLKRDT